MRSHGALTFLAVGMVLAASLTFAQERPEPKTYGTSSLAYHRVGFSEFGPETSVFGYTDSFFGGRFARYPTTGAGFFVAVPHLPSGVLLSAVEFDYCDSNPSEDAVFYVYSTNYDGAAITLIGSTTSTGASGCGFSVADVSAANFVVNNNLNQIVLQAIVTPTDGSVAISGAIARYFLQVSPDPLTATFPDVPVGNPQHQFVEALVAAGITAGCGGGNYCPNAPLTRGQMAVFLSKALGLHWP